MMGDKKPADYRKRILAAFRKEGIDPLRWLNEQIEKHERTPSPSVSNLEALESLRRSLRLAVREDKARKKRRTKTSA